MIIDLVEFSYLNPLTLQATTLGYSSGPGFTPRPGESAPVPWYEPRILQPFDYQCSIFKDGLKGGNSEGACAACQLINAPAPGQTAGFFDFLMGMVLDGQFVRRLRGDSEAPYASFTVVMTGVLMRPEFTWETMNLKVRDYTELFDHPVSQFVYLGNNVAGQGIEGTTDDLMGKTKPLCFGRRWNITPDYVSTAQTIYRVHNGQVQAIDAVYSAGISLPQDMSVGGTVESAACLYVSATSFTVAGNKTAVYVAGLRLLIVQASGNSGNSAVVSSSYSSSTGLTTVVLTTPPVSQAQIPFTLASGTTITKVAYGGGDCATLAALYAATPAAGMYVTSLALGLFKLTGYAGTAITCDVQGAAPGGVYAETIADILTLMATNYAQRSRKNYAPNCEAFTAAGWTNSGFTLKVNPAGVVPPMAGMTLTELSGAAGSSLACTLPLGTNTWCLSWVVQGTGSVSMEIANAANGANNCLGEFNLATGLNTLVQANGNAVGPQYQATGFITAGGAVEEPDGFWRIWISGQPDSTFTSITVQIISNDGAPIIVGGVQVENYSSPSNYCGATSGTPLGTDANGSYYALGYDPVIGPTVNAAALAALKAAMPYEVGYYVPSGDSSTCLDVLDAICEGAMVWYGFDRFGALTGGMLAKPSASATPVISVSSDMHIVQDTLQWVTPFQAKDGTPAFRVSLSTVENSTIQQKSDLATSMWTTLPMRVAWLDNQFRTVTAEDLNALWLHPLACELDFTARFANLSDAVVVAGMLLAFYKNRLDRYTFSIPITADILTLLPGIFSLMVGSVVNLQSERFGLMNGQDFMVIGVTEQSENGLMQLEVLG
jgi:hypothetical protein